MPDVILTDGLLRKTLSATRSLGSKGIRTVVGETSRLSPSGFSKHCHQRITYPDPKLEQNTFLNWLLHHLKQENAPVLLPMDDAVMDIVMEHKEEIQKFAHLLLPSKRSYEIASDKYETMKLAEKQGIKCPATYMPKSEKDVMDIADSAKFPLVIKPRKSSGSRGIRIAESKELLLEMYHDIKRKYPNPMIQECIPLGERYDVCLLFDREHEVKASFVQKEIRHFPIEIGPSTVQKSVSHQPLIEQSIQLLKPLDWSGIVEIEYMIDPRTSEPVLMEINPRFWNSLELAIQCGIDFPYLLYQLSLDEKIPIHDHYETGRMNRWLFPGDMLHFFLNPKRWSMEPPFFSGKRQSVYDDTFSVSDPLPGLIWIFSCCKFAFSLKSWKMFFKR